jgi:hypothetical protein
MAAVRSPADWKVFAQSVACSVRRAAADPALDHARVRVRRGRIVEM